jgi:hypothetical protein
MNTRFTQGHPWAAHYGTPCWHALLLLMLLLWLEKPEWAGVAAQRAGVAAQRAGMNE